MVSHTGEVVSVKASSLAANVKRVEATCSQTQAAAFKGVCMGSILTIKKG